MATKGTNSSPDDGASASLGASADALLLAALNAGEATWETGRSVVTFKVGATEYGIRELQAGGLSVANANDGDYLGMSALEEGRRPWSSRRSEWLSSPATPRRHTT